MSVAQAQDLVPVVCMSSNGCEGDDFGATFPRECCIGNPRGLSYTVPGSEECTDCTGKLYSVPINVNSLTCSKLEAVTM